MIRNNGLMDWSLRHEWEVYSSNILYEYQQCVDEGKDIQALEDLFKEIHRLPLNDFREKLSDVLYQKIASLPNEKDYPYFEPSDIHVIRENRPPRRNHKSDYINPDNLRDKISGAWLGRICGCLLGKPVECYHLPVIKKLLKATNNFPLNRYIEMLDELPNDIDLDMDNYKRRCWIQNVKGCAPIDDDTNYTVLSAKFLIEEYGRYFTSNDVANVWISCQTKKYYCTAERVTYINLINGIQPPYSAIYKNPFREWIGAQIRGDYFGYINPGNAEIAAEMAWRDARISHVKNGIYGEMLISAMLSAASADYNIKNVILVGLGEIPENSRLTNYIRKVIQWHDSNLSYEECVHNIHTIFNEQNAYHWTHILPNAMIVATSLIYGNMDYGKSICMAVQAGFDTDCNGATVGSIVGMIGGRDCIQSEWTSPVNGTIATSLNGLDKIKISDLVDHTMKCIKQ